jgi:hypothetical protein
MFKFLAIVVSIGALVVSGPAAAAQVTHISRNAEASLQLIHDNGRDNDRGRDNNGRDNDGRGHSSHHKKKPKPPKNCSAYKSSLLKKHCEHQNDDDDDDDDGDGGSLPGCDAENDDDCPVSS